MRECITCKENKEESCFGARRKDCKPCRNIQARIYYENNKEGILAKQRLATRKLTKPWKRTDLKRKFNISLEDYNALVEQQNNKCATCGNTSVQSLAVDHDHKTGRIRGLLCRKCNLALGMINDNISILTHMIAYLGEFA